MEAHSRHGAAWNLRGATFMTLAMAGFTLEDSLLKYVAATLSVGQLLLTVGTLGLVAFSIWAIAAGEAPVTRDALRREMVMRSFAEVFGRLLFMLALAYTPLSTTSAILQATPLVVMVGAIFVFGERIGPRRWFAVAAGFGGVLMVLRPGADSFGLLSLLAVLATVGFAGRDLATRAAPVSMSSRQLGVLGFGMVVIAGLLALPFGGPLVVPTAAAWLGMFGAAAIGVVSYTSLTLAMQTGEVGAVTPFRYTRLVFAMAAAVVLFGENPDAWTLIGSTVIIVAGVIALRLPRRVAYDARLRRE